MSQEQAQTAEHNSLASFLEELRKEAEQLTKELREIEVLIKQSSVEVEKLVQRNTMMANKMRQIEANFDTYPREDIKAVYTAAHETQMRLFMMRGQLEQLQNKKESLERYTARVRSFLRFSNDIRKLDMHADLGESEKAREDRESITQIIQAQEGERQRLARQMHDGPAQSLSNLILQAEICERLFDHDPSQARTELKNLKNAVNTTFQQTRSFIFDLRPMMLDDLGLVPTLRRYIEDYEEKTSVKASLNVFGGERRFASHNEVVVFRAVQVLLDNVHRHSQASQAQITLDIQGPAISVVVEDDGSGFNVDEALHNAGGRKARGLVHVMEQVRMLGGTFDIESRLGRGTKVRFEIPAT